MTTWTRDLRPYYAPLAILEWKLDKPRPFEADVKWLRQYTTENPGCVGYVVGLNHEDAGAFSVSVTRVAQGSQQVDWFEHTGRPDLE